MKRVVVLVCFVLLLVSVAGAAIASESFWTMKLKAGLYAEPALVPESPWLGRETPPKPEVSAQRSGSGVAVEMKLPRGKEPWQWLVRVQTADGWKTAIVPGHENQHLVSFDDGAEAKAVVVSAVTRLSRLGRPARAKIESRD